MVSKFTEIKSQSIPTWISGALVGLITGGPVGAVIGGSLGAAFDYKSKHEFIVLEYGDPLPKGKTG